MVKSHLLIRGLVPIFMLIGAMNLPINAQDNEQKDPKALDPRDIFLQAWLTIREGDKFEKAGQYNNARLKYQQAAKYYITLSKFHKNWKPLMVEARIKSTNEAIVTIEPKAIEEIAKKKMLILKI